MSKARSTLTRLRDPSDPALGELADLAVRHWLQTPLAQLPLWPTDVPALQQALADQLEESRADLLEIARRALHAGESEPRTPRQLIPEDAWSPIRLMAGHPLTLSESLTLEVIDQGVVHRLLAEILESALRRFLHKARKVDDRIKRVDERLGGFGRRARGLFGGVAQELANAVGDEVEHSVERRIKDFVKQATSEMLKVAARRIADPSQAEAWGAFRLAVLDVMIDLPVSEWTAQAQAQDPESLLGLLLDETILAIRSSAVESRVTEVLEALVEREGERTPGSFISDDSPLLGPIASQTTRSLRDVVSTEGFEHWWLELHGES